MRSNKRLRLARKSGSLPVFLQRMFTIRSA